MPSRRPVDLSARDEHVSLLKSKTGISRDDSRKKTLSVRKDSLVPMIQADVGSNVPVDVARYRLLVPIAELLRFTRLRSMPPMNTSARSDGSWKMLSARV